MNNQKNGQLKYRDFITFQPDVVKFITMDTYKIIEKYYQIVKALRKQNMTVKEIHNLYIDPESKKHTLTIKTIYRYLEKLEEEKIVVVSGHRETKGSRQVEKLYSRTALIFFTEKGDDYLQQKLEYGKEIASKTHEILGELLLKSEVDLEAFTSQFLKYMKNSHLCTVESIRKIPENKKLADIFSSSDIDQINAINSYLGIFLTYLRYPEIFEEIKALYS